MVKLSEIDIGTKDLIVALLGGVIGYYARKPIEERREAEKQRDAELFGRKAAQYMAEELRREGLAGPETYKALEDLTQTLREVKEILKKYREENG